VVTQVPEGGLTSVEQSLVEAVGRGEWLDLAAADEVIDEAAMRLWDESRTCRARVIRDILRGRLVADPDPHGVRLRGARISGQLDLENLTADVNLELHDCLLAEGINARDARLASVGLVGCQLEHPSEPPLEATRLTCSLLILSRARIIGHTDSGAASLTGAHIGGLLDLNGARFLGHGHGGALSLLGAHIGGYLNCEGASLRNDSGPALKAGGLEVGQDMSLRGGFTATGHGDDGAVYLVGAHIGGQLSCTGASLENVSGPALNADNLQVDRDMFLRDGFTATGAGKDGAVNLRGARIGASLDCDGANLRNDSGPALNASGAEVNQDMSLSRLTATGGGLSGTVNLAGARIGGHFDCIETELRYDKGPALAAYSLQIGGDMDLSFGFTVTGRGEFPALTLDGVRVGGTFRFTPTQIEHMFDDHRLMVDGLTYAGVPDTDPPSAWRRLLQQGTPYYSAQPYQQLAAAYRALGDDRQARRTLMAQRDDQLARTYTSGAERLWGRITKITLGYGYQPWRALLFLAGVVAVSCVLAVVLGAHGALVQSSQTATPGRSCTVVQQVSVGLDLNLPVGTTVARVDCNLTTDSSSATAAWLTVVGWVLRILAWGFAALFIAGFTSAVRKT
jgi:hypothetical protein